MIISSLLPEFITNINAQTTMLLFQLGLLLVFAKFIDKTI